ncbi:hypothetical protein LLH00_00610 [bacterium]|nr:hypothetical protein [bacterium]
MKSCLATVALLLGVLVLQLNAAGVKLSSLPGKPDKDITNLLLVSSPWNPTECLQLNFPEHCWGRGMPDVNHSNPVQVDTPWRLSDDSSRAGFEYSPRDGVTFRAEAEADSMAVRLSLEIDNRTDTAITDIRTLICLRPGSLAAFLDTAYARTFVAVNGRPALLGRDTHYSGPLPESSPVFWALNVAGGPDNLTFDDLGWFRPGSGPGRIVEERADPPLIAVRAKGTPERWLATIWTPARLVFSNKRIPCIHSDPLPPDCPPGETTRARGLVIFHEGSFEGLVERAKALLAKP